ncbi:MAG: aldo/keto reductase [Spirochaetes bacterium]|nr:aldo/keto reductase [Spirochaetota bacterium]
MIYKKFGKTDLDISILGLGCMRFPVQDNKINQTEAEELIMTAIDKGINYLDTAYFYHFGESETLLGQVLTKEIRKKIYLATKLPSWLIKEKADIARYFQEQLDKLQTDYIDFYLIHTLNKNYWTLLKELGVLEWLDNLKKSGKIGYAGFSFHDNYPVFKDIIDGYNWDFCQIQYNFMNLDYQAGEKGLKYAVSKNIPVIVMEPLLGGKLVNTPPAIQEIWNQGPVQRDPVERALQWLWDQPEVSIVLSGMSNLDQLEANIQYAAQAEQKKLQPAEWDLYKKAAAKYLEISPINCTNCKYCLPCPQNVDIPTNFRIFNEGCMYDNWQIAHGQYQWMEQAYQLKLDDYDGRAVHCIQCGECDSKCPQNLPISHWMPKVHKVLDNQQEYTIDLLKE